MKNIWFDWADDLFRPFGAGLFVGRSSVGFTHGYSSCSPPANRNAHHKTTRPLFFEVLHSPIFCASAPLR